MSRRATRRRTAFLAVPLALVAALALTLTPATAAVPRFEAVPGATRTKAPSALQVRIVRYEGGTNGQMVVDVRNRSKKPAKFDPVGLYFVPEGDPERAPQRLGAAGPFVTQVGKLWGPMEQLEVAAGETRRLKLSVFCIDSHRASPSSETRFSLANSRLPKELRQEITAGTKQIMKAKKAKVAADASSEVQSHVWKTRDKKWVALEGERADEKSPAKQHALPMRQESMPALR